MPRNQPYIDPMNSGTFFFGSRCIMPFISRSGGNTNLTVDVMAVAILLAACCDVWCSLMHVSCIPSIKLTAIKQTKTKALGQFYKNKYFWQTLCMHFCLGQKQKNLSPPTPPPKQKKQQQQQSPAINVGSGGIFRKDGVRGPHDPPPRTFLPLLPMAKTLGE